MIIYTIEDTFGQDGSIKSLSGNDSVFKDFDWNKYYFKSAKTGETYSAESNVCSREEMKLELESIIGEELI